MWTSITRQTIDVISNGEWVSAEGLLFLADMCEEAAEAAEKRLQKRMAKVRRLRAHAYNAYAYASEAERTPVVQAYRKAERRLREIGPELTLATLRPKLLAEKVRALAAT